MPLAGLVVVSDGADTTGDAVEPALLALKASGVPVFAIGLGRDTAEKDIQVGRVTAPRAVLTAPASGQPVSLAALLQLAQQRRG